MKKVFNWSELHLSEVTSYKIHTLVKHCLAIAKSAGSVFVYNIFLLVVSTLNLFTQILCQFLAAYKLYLGIHI